MTSGADRAPLVLIANARMPSQRAQSLQVAQVAASFARTGRETTLLYARRRGVPVVSPDELWDTYQVPIGSRPNAEAIRCMDWIEAVPRSLQYAPARVQELSFARGAARRARRGFKDALVLSREIETAHVLRRRPGVFLEIHRVPGGRTRRRWLLDAARQVAGVIAISGGVRGALVALGVSPEAITVEHDGFERTRFEGLASKTEARVELGLDPDRPTVVYTGGLLEWKGVDVLTDAARFVDEAQFVIAGGMDADVGRLRERAAGLDNVRVDGFQPPRKVALYLAAADVGVVPNRSKPDISALFTSPLKVFEAMAAGLPLVASDRPSLRGVPDAAPACSVAPDDAHALAEGLRGLLADESAREAMAAALIARSAEHTWDARAARLSEWMEARA